MTGKSAIFLSETVAGMDDATLRKCLMDKAGLDLGSAYLNEKIGSISVGMSLVAASAAVSSAGILSYLVNQA